MLYCLLTKSINIKIKMSKHIVSSHLEMEEKRLLPMERNNFNYWSRLEYLKYTGLLKLLWFWFQVKACLEWCTKLVLRKQQEIVVVKQNVPPPPMQQLCTKPNYFGFKPDNEPKKLKWSLPSWVPLPPASWFGSSKRKSQKIQEDLNRLQVKIALEEEKQINEVLKALYSKTVESFEKSQSFNRWVQTPD